MKLLSTKIISNSAEDLWPSLPPIYHAERPLFSMYMRYRPLIFHTVDGWPMPCSVHLGWLSTWFLHVSWFPYAGIFSIPPPPPNSILFQYSTCWKAGPSSILGPAPHGGFPSLRCQTVWRWRGASTKVHGWMSCMYMWLRLSECMFKNKKINKKRQPTINLLEK